MKKETYEKAMKAHEKKLMRYQERLHELVDEMRADGCSMGDVISVLEVEKLFRFDRVADDAKREAGFGAINDLLEELVGGDAE